MIIINKYIGAITSISLFSSFTKEELSIIFSSLKYQIREYRKGQTIHLQNELCSTLDIIIDGRVVVQHIDEDGNILTINVFSNRGIIGASLLFSNRNYYPMTIESIDNTIILHMQRDLVLELCKNNVDFMVKLMTIISDRSIILTDKINMISLKTIRQKIIDYLRYEFHIQRNKVIKLNMSKKELAERLGIQRSFLSRELNKMRKDGLVEYDARTITIKNIDI
ncbi:Crp/Fnr family transcriptional regulator [Schnuerera sp. xch1]|uniref:Crp/Fnr family transcriptional regulator n=1 Tax=Schnuerera sp. xch1 TaxID=2874283 RepID=UPI001CC0DB4B|nr:Crp/Fnr family transcriptional regulator [Schnuerera sp. xch1]MBZ2174252.1 Crp/Fnr family transcriptional regulator [Schnuerera sp. xch1]